MTKLQAPGCSVRRSCNAVADCARSPPVLPFGSRTTVSSCCRSSSIGPSLRAWSNDNLRITPTSPPPVPRERTSILSTHPPLLPLTDPPYRLHVHPLITSSLSFPLRSNSATNADVDATAIRDPSTLSSLSVPAHERRIPQPTPVLPAPLPPRPTPNPQSSNYIHSVLRLSGSRGSNFVHLSLRTRYDATDRTCSRATAAAASDPGVFFCTLASAVSAVNRYWQSNRPFASVLSFSLTPREPSEWPPFARCTDVYSLVDEPRLRRDRCERNGPSRRIRMRRAFSSSSSRVNRRGTPDILDASRRVATSSSFVAPGLVHADP